MFRVELQPLRLRLIATFLCVAGGLGSSCASYTHRTAAALSDFQSGNLEAARERYADRDVTRSKFLSGAESGMVAMAAGRWEEALEHLAQAAEAVEDVEERALVSATDLGETLISWATNESVFEYEGEGFERVMLHACIGLCYLALGKLDDVWVEARLANKLLETEEELYDKEYAAGGLGHFLSALAYELLGRYDEAYIDYRRMVEKGVGTAIAGKALVRLARELNYTDDLEHWSAEFGAREPVDPDAASVVIVAGIGLGPYKRESGLNVPTGSGIYSWSIPVLTARPQPVSGLVFSVAGSNESVRTSVIEDVARVSNENLEDRIAWLAGKSALRGFLKRELTKELEEDYGTGGRILGDLWTLATERADLRGWNTLPDTWHAARVFLPAGDHAMMLEALGGERRSLGVFRLEPGETLFVLARSVGNRLYAYPIGGEPLELIEQPPDLPSGPFQP